MTCNKQEATEIIITANEVLEISILESYGVEPLRIERMWCVALGIDEFDCEFIRGLKKKIKKKVKYFSS